MKFNAPVILTALIFMTPALSAAEEAVSLEKIVVTPYRYEETLGKTASSVTVITPAEIKNANAEKTVDMLRSVPGVTVRDWYGNGVTATVDMAGFGGQAALNVLVLVDGRRVNDIDLSGVDWNQIPLDQVERIEVIRGGSASVLYGDNASSGVINIITKKGSGKPKFNLETQYGSYDMNAQKLSLGGDIDKKFSYWFGAGHQANHGYRNNTFNKTTDFASKLAYNFNDALSAHFNSGFHTAAYGMPGALWQANLDREGRRFARYGKDHANNKDFYFVLGSQAKLASLGAFDIDFTYRQKEVDSYFLTSGNPTQRNAIETLGIMPKYTLGNSILGHENKLIAGLDYYRVFYHSNTYAIASDALQAITRINKDSVGGYLQNEFSVLERLVLVGGYRYEVARYVFGYHDNDTSWGHPYPDQDKKTQLKMKAFNTGLVYTYQNDSSAFFNIGRSFRFPEVDEFTYNDATWQQQLDTGLKPQSSFNYQLGIRHAFSDRLKGSFSLFRMKVRDELHYNSTGGPLTSGKNENYDKTIHEGLEVSLDSKLSKRVAFFSNYTFTKAFFVGSQYNKNEIPMAPRHKGSVGLRFLLPRNIAFNLTGNYVGRRYFLNDEANEVSRLNGYMVTDTNLSWRSKDLTVTFGINNLFNRHYSEYAGYAFNGAILANDKFYFPSPERNFTFKMDYRF
jgi:iron complex outermembrane receptor protein